MHRLPPLFVAAALSAPFSIPLPVHGENLTQGTNAGAAITTGDYNTLLGVSAGERLTTHDFNTFIGYGAGRWIADDSDNTAIGFGAGAGATDVDGTETIDNDGSPIGFDNTFVGARAGLRNRATDNTFVGADAGAYNTVGFDNTFVGETAGYKNIDGDDNTFVGENAGYSNTTASDNTAVGSAALNSNTTGAANTVVGVEAGYDITTGVNNTAVGAWSGEDMSVSLCNTTVGSHSGRHTEHADFNTFIGALAGWDNNRTNNTHDANANTYLGFAAGLSNREGENNVVLGAFADFSNQDESSAATACQESVNWTGTAPDRLDTDVDVDNVVAVGSSIKITGDDSIVVGYNAANSGFGSVVAGSGASSSHARAVVIGYQAASHGNDRVTLGNADTVSWDPGADGTVTLGSAGYRFEDALSQKFSTVAAAGAAAEIDLFADAGSDNADQWSVKAADDGNLSITSFATGADVALITLTNGGNLTVAGDITINSDARLKQGVEPIPDATALLSRIDGKRYRWRAGSGRDQALHYGLIAQQVEAVLPELVSHSEKGIKSVNYQAMVAVVVSALNEQGRLIERQRRTIDRLERVLGAMDEGMRRQRVRLDALEAAAAGGRFVSAAQRFH